MRRVRRILSGGKRQVDDIEQAARGEFERYERHWTVRLVRNYLDDDADGLASIIAFAAMFSMMPILIVTFAFITMLLQLDAVRDFLTGLLAEDVPTNVSDRIEQLLETGEDNFAGLGLLTFITFLLGGSKLFGAMDRACARIFRTERRPYTSRKLFSILMMPLIPVLLLVTTIISTVATAALALPLEQLFDINPTTQDAVIGYVVAFAIAFALMFLAYRRIPEKGPDRRDAASGAAVAAVLIVLLAQFFPLYIKLTGGYSLYGSIFAFVLLVLLWLYLMGQIFVIGAEIAALRAGRRGDGAPSGSDVVIDGAARDESGGQT